MYMLPGEAPVAMSVTEKAFWRDLGEFDPGFTSYALADAYRDRTPPDEVKEIVRTYLTKERLKPSVTESGVQAFYNLKAALVFLGSWNAPEDTALLKSFLNYPFTEETRWSDGKIETVWPVKEAAKRLLEGR
jgi:hypothetical protein